MQDVNQNKILNITFQLQFIINTIKPLNKGHPRERQIMVFIDKWSLFGGYFV